MVNPWGEETDYLYDYPAGYYSSAAAMAAAKPKPMPMPMPLASIESGIGGILGGLDTMKLLKTAGLAAALWFWAIPKGAGKDKLLKVGVISGVYYFLG
jgi:hypothetical protein